jgi:hypothetical protein
MALRHQGLGPTSVQQARAPGACPPSLNTPVEVMQKRGASSIQQRQWSPAGGAIDRRPCSDLTAGAPGITEPFLQEADRTKGNGNWGKRPRPAKTPEQGEGSVNPQNGWPPAPRWLEADGLRAEKKKRGGVAVLALGLCLLGLTARAEPVETPVTRYLNRRSFSLPIQIDPRVQDSLREVQLWVRQTAEQPWTLAQRAAPTQKEFRFQANQDGEYQFTLVTVDVQGRATPADLTHQPPSVVVIVDTQPPEVELRLLSAGDSPCVQCCLRDAHPDPERTRFEFQTGDRVWRSLEPENDKPDVYRIPSQAVITGWVRVCAVDKAGNRCTREVNLSELARVAAGPVGAPAPSTAAAPPAAPAAAEESGPVLPPPEGLQPASHQEPRSPAATPALLEGHSARKVASAPRPLPPVPLTPARTTPPTPPAGRLLINCRRLLLDYQIEAEDIKDVSKIEIYLTRDQGRSWQRWGKEIAPGHLAEVELPGEGLFGLCLVAQDRQGRGVAPQPGQAPDRWIEVDLTPPQLTDVEVRPDPDSPQPLLVVHWQAQDRNLKAAPIDLFWSSHPQGPWQVIARGLKNEPPYHWPVPSQAGAQVYVRLTVADQAGNRAEWVTPQAVATGWAPPVHIRLVGVRPLADEAPTLPNRP